MLPFVTKKNYLLFLLSLTLFFSILTIFQVFPGVRLGNRVLAIDSKGCEGGWTFNGGDAGDDSNWDYTGCEEDSGGGGSDNEDDNNWWDQDEEDDDNDNNNYCDEDTWTNEETDGSYWCDNGRICFEQWGRDKSCNIYRDGEDCRSDYRCQQQGDESGDNSCEYKFQYTECQSDGQIYEAWKDCNGNWDPRPTGQSCAESGGQQEQQENQGSCGSNQYWDTSVGRCVVNDLEQTKINDETYCREQCNNSCTGGLGHMRCTQPDGSFTYDCNDPENQANLAECQGILEEEFAHVGIDPIDGGGMGAGDLASQSPSCGYADLDSGECRGSQYCQTHIMYCDGQISGKPEIGGNCNLVPGLCGVKADEEGKLYVARPACNPECGDNEQCMDDGNGAGFCQANTENAPPITVIDDQRKIRVEGTTLRIGEGAAGVSLCQNIADAQEKHNCLVEYAKTHIEDFTGQPVSSTQSGPSDTTCQAETPSQNYCDGNVCIEKSSGWDGNACVAVYKTVSNSNCNNSCSNDSQQSGETVKLLNCMELQGNDKEICQKENDRIYNTGQKVDQISLFKASISITDCNNLVDDAKAACEKSNTFSREFVKALDKLKLEDCTTYTTRDEQNICDGRNKDAIYLAKVKTDLGVDDCSNLSGSEKTNCDFKNYYLNKTANILANYFPEDCSKYQTASEIAACDENNKQTYKNAFNLTPFVGSVEMGASCVYTETCTEGGKKACAGKVANDNGAPVCRYDPGVASCSACSTGELDLAAVAKQAAEQAAANAPIDPAKYFSQKFEEGVACKQVQSCGDGQEQVCEGKGSNGACDLSQGGGICSPCQAKGTITLNRVASCNAQNKCEGAPALSGCMNDDQCKPPPPPPPAASLPQGSVVGNDGQIYQAIQKCRDVMVNSVDANNNYNSCQAESARAIAAGDLPNCDQYAFGAVASQKAYTQCTTNYVATGRYASSPEEQQKAQLPPQQQERVNNLANSYLQANLQYSELAQSATNNTNQYLELERQLRDMADAAAVDPLENTVLLARLREAQEKAAQENAKLLGVQSNLNNFNQNIGLAPVQDIAGRNISQVDQSGSVFQGEIERRQGIVDETKRATTALAEAQKYRLQFERSTDYNPDPTVLSQNVDDDPLYKQKIQEAQTAVNNLKNLGAKGNAAQLEHTLTYLPQRTGEVRSTERIVEAGTQMVNLLQAHADLNGQTNVGREEVQFLQDAGLSYVDKLRTQGGAVATTQANQLEARVGNAAYNAWAAEYQQEFKAGRSLDPDTNNTIGGIINGLNTAADQVAVTDPAKAQALKVQVRVMPEILAAQEYSKYVKNQAANKQLTDDEKAALDEGFKSIVDATIQKAGDGKIVGDLQDKYAIAAIEGTAQRLINERLTNAKAGNIETDEQSAELSRKFIEQVINPLTLADKADTARVLQNSFNTAPSVGSAQGNLSLATRLAINDAGNPDKDLTPQTTALENARLAISALPETPEKAKLNNDLNNFNQNISTILDRKRAVDNFLQEVNFAALNSSNQNTALTEINVERAKANFDALPADLKTDPNLSAQAASLDTIAKISNQREVMNDWYQAAAQAKAAGDEAGYQDALEKARQIYGATVVEAVSLPENLKPGTLASLTGESNKNELEIGTRVSERAAELASRRESESADSFWTQAKALGGVIAAANNVVSCFNVVSGAVLEGCGEVRGNTVQSGYRLIESLNKWQQEHPGAVGIQGIAGAIGLDMGKNLVTEGVTATSFGSPETKMQTGLNTLEQTGNLDAALKAVGLSTFSPLTLSFNTDTPQVKQRAEETAALAGILPKNYAELLKTGQMTQDQIDQRMNPSTWTPTQKQAFFAFLPHEDPNPLKWASKNLFNAEISINPFIHQGSSQLICQSSYGSICNSGYQQLSTMSNQDYQQANRVLGEILPGYQPSDYESLNSYINAKNSCMASGGGAANYEFCTANAASSLGLNPDQVTKLETDYSAYGYAAEYVKNNTEPGKFSWEMQLNTTESVGNMVLTGAIALPIAAVTGGTGFASLTGLDVFQAVPLLARGGVRLAQVGVREAIPEAAGLLRGAVSSAIDAPGWNKIPAFFDAAVWDAPKYAKNADDAIAASSKAVLAAQDNLARVQQAKSDFERAIQSDPNLQNDPLVPSYLDLADTKVKDAEALLDSAYESASRQVGDLARYDQEVFEAQLRFNNAQLAYQAAERNELPVSQIDALKAKAEQAALELQGAKTQAIIADLGETVKEVPEVRLAQDRVNNLNLLQEHGASVDPNIIDIANSELTQAQARAIQNQYGLPLDQVPQVASIPPPTPNIFERIADGFSSVTSRFSGNTPPVANQTPPVTAQAAVGQTPADPLLLNAVKRHPEVSGYNVSSDATGQKITVKYRDGRPPEEFTPDQLRADPRFNPNGNTAQNTANAAPNTGAAASNPQPNAAQSQPQPGVANNAAPQTAQAAPQSAGFFDPVRKLWNRVTGQTPQQPVVIDTAQRVQQRAQAATVYTQEKSKLDQLQQAFDNAFTKLEEARIANEHAVAYRKEVENRSILQQLIGANQTAINEARLRQELTEKQLKDAKTVLDQAFQDLSPQKIKTLEAELAKGDLTAEQAHEMRLEATRTFIKAKKTITDNEKALDVTKGKLWKEVDATQKMYVQTYRDLFNYNRTPNPVDEARFMESWKNYTAALEAAVGKADDASVKSAADNLKLGSTKLSPDGAEKLAAAIGIMNDKIAVVNKAQRELAEAQQVVTNYKAEVALLRQINVDARLEQELVTNQNKGTLSQIEQALKQQGITGRTEVKLYLDSNGELLLTPDAGINPQAVIGIFNRSGDSIKLEKVIISTSTAPKAGEKASAVFSQLDEISPRRTVRFWEKNIEIEKEPVSSGTTRFQSRFDNAIDVNIQNISPTSPSTVTPISAEQIEKEAKADLVGRQKVIFDSNTGQITSSPVSENQIRLTLIRRGYDPNDPSLDEAVRRISDEINPQSQAVQESVIEQSYDELNRLIDQDTANSSPEVQAKMKQIAEIVRKRDEKLAAMASANGGEFIPFKVEDQFRELAAFRRDLGISGVTVNERPTGPVLQTISSTTGRTTTFKSIETIPQGLIVFPPKTIPAEDTVRLYRGVGDFDMNTPQLAALARSGEVSTQDIFDFWDGKITYDDLIDKLDDQSTIDFIRDQIQVQKRNNPDWTNDQILAWLHNDCQRGQNCGSLFVSTTNSVEEAFRFGRRPGEVLNGVIVMDVPKSVVNDISSILYPSTVGSEQLVLGEIKPEWIRGFVSVDQNMSLSELENGIDIINQKLEARLPLQQSSTIKTSSVVQQVDLANTLSPFAQAIREVPTNPRTGNAVSAAVDDLGDQLDAFYISLENNLRHASARANLDQLPEIRALLIQAEARLGQVKPEYTNAVQQQKLIMQRVEEARTAGTLNQTAIDQFNRELAPLNETISRLKPIYLELENEILPGIRAEYRIPSATVANRVGEELTRRGINPNFLSADDKIDLYLHLKQANTVAPANPAAVPAVEQAVQNATGAVQGVVDTAGSATENAASAVRAAAVSAPAPVQAVADVVADTAEAVNAVIRGNSEPLPSSFVSTQIRNNPNVQGYSIEGVLREDARVTITFKNNPTPETKTLAAWRADTRITNPEIPEIPVSFANQVNGSTPVVSQEEAIAETIKKIKGFTRIYETETWTPNPISKTEIRRFLIEAGFSGTPEQLDQAIVQVGAKVNSTSGINPRQVVTAVPGVGPFIDGIADTADLVNGARVVAADELERAADVARTLGNNDLALTLEGQAQILRRGDVVIDDSAGVSLQTVEQRLGRSLSNDERQFVSEALNAQQSTDAHFTEIAQRLGGQYVAPSEDEIHRIVDRGLKSQRGSDSFTLIDSSREPADLSEAIRKIQYSSDGLPVNIQWYAPGDATPYAISRFDIGGYIIRPAIRVEDPNYITLFRGVGRVVPERAEVPPMVRNGVATIEDLQALIAKGNKMTDQDVIDLLSKSPSAKKEQLIADFKSEAVRIRQKLGPQTSTLEVISDIHADCGANSECLSFLISSTNDFDFAFEWATGKKSPRTSASGAEAVEILRVPRDRTINLIENGINPEEQEVAILGAIEDIWRQGVIYVRAKNIDEYHQVLNRFGQSRNAMEEAGRTVIPFEVAGRLLDAAENIPPLPGVAVIPDIARVVNDITDGFDNASTTNLRVSELEEQARLAREFGDADQAYQLEVEAQALRVQGTNCNLTSIPQSPNLALANLTTNVLGVSTQGEVLAVSASNCGPFATAWLEMSKSQGGKVLDTMTNGKLFDAYTEIFVKVDASLPEPVLNIGNQVIGLFKKPADSLDQAAKITPAPIVKEIPILKPMVEETPKFSKKLSADEQFISEYFDQIKTGQVADGQFMLYFDPISGKIVTTNVSASDIVPLEIQIFRNSDSSLDISSLRIPSEYAYGNSIYSIINTLEELTDSRVLHINQTSKQKLFALEGTIPAIIQPDLVTMTSVLLTKPDVARLYANRQIEQNWLNKNLENLLGDNYINLRQKALPPDPYREVPKQLDTSYSQYKAGEINETQLIEQVEAIAGIHSQSQKIQEIPLFIDERFLRTGLLAGRDIEDIKHWFGAGEWAGWLGARKVAQSYGNRPLSASFINNLHQALLLPASPKENVLIGDFRLSAMFGFKKDNPGEFPISKITVINENPYLKFIETPVPEGKIARPDATKWGYIQYPRVGDADFMNSLPDHIKAKLSPRPTNQELVQVLVEDVIDWYNTQSNLPGVDRIALAAELQRRLISVHPFGDANGRLSRIVMNWSLENAGYPAPRIVNFNADIESPLEQWIETVRNGIAREQKVQEKLKLMEEIGWVDPVEALGYSELKTFYDLMAKNGNFTNSSRLLPEVNGQIKRTPYGSLNDLNRDIVLAWNNFHKMFGGESQVLPDGTKITVGGLVPQSYIDLVRMKNPKNFEAYEKLIKEFYSNRDVTVYRGIPISTPADTPQRVAALFETPRSALNSYYSNTFSSSKSPRFLRLENPNMPSTDVLKESLARGLENYNESVIDDYTDILDDETIQMEDKIDSLRRKIKIHTVGNSLETDVSPFVSVSTSKGVADNFAGGEYYNLFFNNSTGKPNKRQASIVVTSKLPAQGVVPTFNTGYQVIGFTNSQPQIIPGIGGLLSIHTGELEILVPGGMNPAHIERIQVKVRTNDISDPSWKSYKFDAVKSIKDDGVYVEVKEMVIGSDGHATGSVRQTTLFKLNPSTGKYQEVSTINTVEDILNSIINNPILKGFTATNLATS